MNVNRAQHTGHGCEVLCKVVQEYEERIAARAAAVAGSGTTAADGGAEAADALPQGLKLEDASVLAEPGKRSGQIVVVRENGAGVAYSWDADRCAAGAPCTDRSLGCAEAVSAQLTAGVGPAGKLWPLPCPFMPNQAAWSATRVRSRTEALHAHC